MNEKQIRKSLNINYMKSNRINNSNNNRTNSSNNSNNNNYNKSGSRQDSILQAQNLRKRYRGFELSVPSLELPRGFAAALIGENGAGKTTLLNLLAGIRLNYKGEITCFEKQGKGIDGSVQERIGYTGPGSYFLPQWTIRQVEEISELLFTNFRRDRFRALCDELGIGTDSRGGMGGFGYATKEVKKLSDGNRMKLMLAAVLARDTELLILDEPASPLDPLMRDKLCDMIREYLEQGDGERSVFFSTHNIADMESVTDYCFIMEHGSIVEEGFVEDLKEKYILVKGEAADAKRAGEILFSMNRSVLPSQLIYSLSVSNMVLASPMRRKMQTVIPVSVNLLCMMMVYLVEVLMCGITAWRHPEQAGEIYWNLVIFAVMQVMMMVYLGLCYKHFVLATLIMIPEMVLWMRAGLDGWIYRQDFGTDITLGMAVPAGFVLIAAGGLAEYLLTLAFYRTPMARMAQAAPLRKEL